MEEGSTGGRDIALTCDPPPPPALSPPLPLLVTVPFSNCSRSPSFLPSSLVRSLLSSRHADSSLTLVVRLPRRDGRGILVGDGLLCDGRAEEAQQNDGSTHCDDGAFVGVVPEGTRVWVVKPINSE